MNSVNGSGIQTNVNLNTPKASQDTALSQNGSTVLPVAYRAIQTNQLFSASVNSYLLKGGTKKFADGHMEKGTFD